MGQWQLDTVDLTGVVSQRHVSWVEGILLIDKLTRKTSLCSPQKCTAHSCIAFVNEETSNLSCPCTVCYMCITPVLFFNTTIRYKFYIFSPYCMCKTFLLPKLVLWLTDWGWSSLTAAYATNSELLFGPWRWIYSVLLWCLKLYQCRHKIMPLNHPEHRFYVVHFQTVSIRYIFRLYILWTRCVCIACTV
jgi:hypothetical protein